MTDQCQVCDYVLREDEELGDHCPKCGEPFWVVECQECGYQPDDDALIQGLRDGHCPKCAGDWDEEGEGECDHAYAFDGGCLYCGKQAGDFNG